jgi:hypothetical protein
MTININRRTLTVSLSVAAAMVITGTALAASTADPAVEESPHKPAAHASGDGGGHVDQQLAQANLATAAYQDVAVAEADGWLSTLGPGEGSLGCFENPDEGGMGVHYLNAALLDHIVDIAAPEALVYELDSNANIAGLVAHEYIVPVDAWTKNSPPRLFGQRFHQHPVLPLWILHTWIWKDNPAGMFEDFNPKVRLCPDGVPVFGE